MICRWNHDEHLCEHLGNPSHECVYIVQEDCPYYRPCTQGRSQEDNEEEKMARDSKATYYDAGGIETLDIIEAKVRDPESYILGNILKYACRLQHKGKKREDTRKLRVYAQRLEELANKEKEEDDDDAV